MSRIITVFILLVSFGSAHPVFAVEWLKKLFNSEKAITAHITLVNKCELDTKYFVVRDLNTKKFAAFQNRIAKLETTINAPLQIQLAPSVKHVFFEGTAISAKEKLTMVADCRDRHLGLIEQQ